MPSNLSREQLAPVVEGMRKFSATPDQLIPLLQYVQGQLGYLAPEAMGAVADYLRLPLSHIYGVATFYAQFRFSPLGKNRITCCRGTACHVRGGKKVFDELSERLGIEDGGTTPDLQFSLETVACVGSCALAPVVVVNNRLHSKVTPKKMNQIVDEILGIAPAPEATDTEAEEKKPAPKPAPKPATAAPAPSLTKPAPAPAVKKPAPKAAVKKAAKKAPAPKVKPAKKAKPAKAAKGKPVAKKAAAKKAAKPKPAAKAKPAKAIGKKTAKKSGAKNRK